MDSLQAQKDAKDLQHLGYVQELFRDMGGFSNFAVSFSVISILTGIPQLYGYGLTHGGPVQMSLGWLLVSVFTLLVSLSMAELASSYPTAGALYHWASFLGGRRTGWFTACFNTLGMFAILAGIDYGLAQFLIALMGWPGTPLFLTSLYAALLLSHALLNHFGIKLVAWLNDFSAGYHIVVVLVILGVLLTKGLAQPPSFLFTFKVSDGFHPAYSFLVGLLLSQWTLTGYDASAHVSEETVDPRRRAPWGIFLAVVISIIFGFVMLAAVTLSIPDLGQALGFGDNAFVEIIKLRLGPGLGTTIIALIAGAMWLCGLSSMTSASRMVYAFARDGGLPLSKVWSKVSKAHRTPSNAIWGLAFIAMILAVSSDSLNAVTSIAVIALYISYGTPIASRLYHRFKHGTDEIGPWNLGRFSTPVAFIATAWICCITVLFVLPPNAQAGKIIGSFFVLFVLIWFFAARNRFEGPKYKIKENAPAKKAVGG